MNMDYSLCQALKYNMNGISRAVVCYDIACQYFIHFHDRVQQNDHLEIPPNLNIEGLIGHFHINGHQDKCYTRHSPYFVPGIGKIDGEIIETLWSQLNEVAGSTRSMSKFHRRETLDDHMNDSNWKKHLRMTGALTEKLKCAQAEVQDATEFFEGLTEETEPELIREWQTLERKALRQRQTDLDAMEIFDMTAGRGNCLI